MNDEPLDGLRMNKHTLIKLAIWLFTLLGLGVMEPKFVLTSYADQKSVSSPSQVLVDRKLSIHQFTREYEYVRSVASAGRSGWELENEVQENLNQYRTQLSARERDIVPNRFVVLLSRVPCQPPSKTACSKTDDVQLLNQLNVAVTKLGGKVLKNYSTLLLGAAVQFDGSAVALQTKLDKFATNALTYPVVKVRAHLSRSVNQVHAPLVWAQHDQSGNAVRGRGVRIAIIDTGIDYHRPEFGSCATIEQCPKFAFGSYNFISPDGDPLDDNGHGTHVASIAAGQGSHPGVAPDALLLAIKVLDDTGFGTSDLVIAGLEQAADPNQNGNTDDHVEVANLSLGGYEPPDGPVALAAARLSDLGVVVVVASEDQNGVDGWLSTSSPANASNVISVANADWSGLGLPQVAYSGGNGPVLLNGSGIQTSYLKPDLIAPGMHICAARAAALDPSNTEGPCDGGDFVKLSGSSFAAPHVAGVAALLRQQIGSQKVARIKTALISSATTNLPQLYSLVSQGHGVLDADRAVRSPKFVALFHRVEQDGRNLRIFGHLDNIQKFKIFTAPYRNLTNLNPEDWKELCSGEAQAIDGLICERSLFSVPQGKRLLRLNVVVDDVEIVAGYTYFESERVKMITPLPYDLTNSREPLQIEIAPNSPAITGLRIANVSYRFDLGNWRTSEITRTRNPLLAILTLPTISRSTRLDVRVTAQYDGGSDLLESFYVNIDPDLREGFPVRFHWDEEWHYGGLPAGIVSPMNPVTGNFNDTTEREIAFFWNGNQPALRVFNLKGKMIANIPVGPARPIGIGPALPWSVDIDRDGQDELLAFRAWLEGDQRNAFIFAFNLDGTSVNGFPLAIDTNFVTPSSEFTVGDVNRNGQVELILAGRNAPEPAVTIIDPVSQNTQVIPITTPASFWLIPRSGPFVGDFDSRAGNEIALIRNDGTRDSNGDYLELTEIDVFSPTGERLPNMPRQFLGYDISERFPGIGRIDGDDFDDIAIVPSGYVPPPNRVPDIIATSGWGIDLPGFPIYLPLRQQNNQPRYYLQSSANVPPVNGAPSRLMVAGSDYEARQNVQLNLVANATHLAGWPKEGAIAGVAGFGDPDRDGRVDVMAYVDNGPYPLTAYVRNGVITPGLMVRNLISGAVSTRLSKRTEPINYVEARPPLLEDLDGDNKAELITVSTIDMNLDDGGQLSPRRTDTDFREFENGLKQRSSLYLFDFR